MELQQGQAGPLRSQQPEQIRRRRQQRPGLGSPHCGPGTLDCGRCVLDGGVLIAGSVTRVSPGLPARHRGTLSCKHHTETFSDSHAHGLFIWGLQLRTFSNLWLSAASFLPLLSGNLRSIRVLPGLCSARSRCVRSWTRDGTGSGTRSAPRPPQFPPRGPAPRSAPPLPPSAPHQDGPVLLGDPALLLAAKQVAHGGPPRRPAEPVAAALRPPYSTRPTAAAWSLALQNAKQLPL